MSSVSEIQDEGFHEIQLSGKQLVFLFMAATVVSVVIFLCGVLVGRGVRAERIDAASTLPASSSAELTTPRQSQAVPTPAPDPAAAPAPPAVNDLTYFNRLQQTNPPAEKLKAAAPPPAPAEASAPVLPAPRPSVAAPTKPTATAAAKPAAADSKSNAPQKPVAPSGQPYTVQVAALNGRPEADAMAKRLSAKGYGAYVVPLTASGSSLYRVRVGKFGTQREAETVAARLRKEEQFKPFVTK